MRRSLKNVLVTYLSTIPGIKRVFAGSPKTIDPRTLPAIVIALPDQDERRASATAGVGKKRLKLDVRLTLIAIDNEKDSVVGELAFDDLIDAVTTKIREYPSLNPPFDFPTAGLEYIRAEASDPRLTGKDGGDVFRAAVIEFDVIDFVVG